MVQTLTHNILLSILLLYTMFESVCFFAFHFHVQSPWPSMQFWRLIFRESKCARRRTCSIRIPTRRPNRKSKKCVKLKYPFWQSTQRQFSLILLLHIGIRYSVFYIALLWSWLTSTECDLGIGFWCDCPRILGFTATDFRTLVRIIFPLWLSLIIRRRCPSCSGQTRRHWH